MVSCAHASATSGGAAGACSGGHSRTDGRASASPLPLTSSAPHVSTSSRGFHQPSDAISRHHLETHAAAPRARYGRWRRTCSSGSRSAVAQQSVVGREGSEGAGGASEGGWRASMAIGLSSTRREFVIAAA